MIPSFAVLQLESPHVDTPRIWLPLFLLWIPVLLLSPLIFVVLFGVCVAGRIRTGRAVGVFWSILCGLPGTQVQVGTRDSKVLVRIW